YDVLWKVPVGGDEQLVLSVEMPEGTTTIGERRTLVSQGALTQRWSVRRPGGLDGTTIFIDGLAATLTDVLVRVERLDGTTQVTRLTPAGPSFVVEAMP